MTTYRARVCVVDNQKEASKGITLFQNDLETLFGHQLQLDEDSVLKNMLFQLPVTFTAKMQGNNLYSVQKS